MKRIGIAVLMAALIGGGSATVSADRDRYGDRDRDRYGERDRYDDRDRYDGRYGYEDGRYDYDGGWTMVAEVAPRNTRLRRNAVSVFNLPGKYRELQVVIRTGGIELKRIAVNMRHGARTVARNPRVEGGYQDVRSEVIDLPGGQPRKVEKVTIAYRALDRTPVRMEIWGRQ
jgi:hypothetical protein